MTLKELSRYYESRKRLTLYETTLESLRSAAETITQELSDMPRSLNPKDKVSAFAAQIVDLEEQISKLRKRADHEREIAADYVESIQDAFTKTIFGLRFVECLTWADIAVAIGGDNTEDSVKKVCYRYMNGLE